jgi:hypothetical protein
MLRCAALFFLHMHVVLQGKTVHSLSAPNSSCLSLFHKYVIIVVIIDYKYLLILIMLSFLLSLSFHIIIYYSL